MTALDLLHHVSIDALGRELRERRVSPVDAVEACLQRIRAINPELNAFITVLEAEALDQARVAEAEIGAGAWRGMLHGVPVALKDFFDVRGVRTTAGSERFANRVATADAGVVKRLRDAGAVIVGKTNMDSLGMATTGLTSCFGPVRNPWNVDYVTGGSSAGSAAAVAAGLCYATVDTDAVGSVRLPASCCGIVGFKGTYGLVSTAGILGDEPVDDFIRWMGHAGICTRSVADTVVVLNALAGRVANAPLTTQEREIRIGVGTNIDPTSVIRDSFESAVDTLRSLGFRLLGVTVPFGDPSQNTMATIERARNNIAREAFGEADVIILPTLDSPVPTVEEASHDPAQGVAATHTAFANYYGLPAVSVPCGLDGHGLPIGLQFVGKPGDDDAVLTAAARYTSAPSHSALSIRMARLATGTTTKP